MTTPSHDRGMSREQIETMPAGPEMDGLVAERVMGHVWRRFPGGVYLTPSGEVAKRLGWDQIPEATADEARLARDKYIAEGGTIDSDTGERIGAYSTDIAAAWEVVEKMHEKRWSFRLTWNCAWPKGEPAIQKILDPTGLCTGLVNTSFGARQYGLVEHTAADAPLAICRAALLATLTGATP